MKAYKEIYRILQFVQMDSESNRRSVNLNVVNTATNPPPPFHPTSNLLARGKLQLNVF